MNDSNDSKEVNTLSTPRRRGRPATGNALTPAQKQAAYRARLRQNCVTVTFDRVAIEALECHVRALVCGYDAPIKKEQLDSILDSLRYSPLRQLI
ncbi:hypothetical protein [Aeromonas dhakensis]|uniref:hypothetical protein n=1 Tax=Aeromonas dhakensis TaxID=196024 RepID=UPI003F7ABAC9